MVNGSDSDRINLDTSACKIVEKNVYLNVQYMYIVVDSLRRDDMTSSDWPKMQVVFILKSTFKIIFFTLVVWNDFILISNILFVRILRKNVNAS